jgi:hypothetical protein
LRHDRLTSDGPGDHQHEQDRRCGDGSTEAEPGDRCLARTRDRPLDGQFLARSGGAGEDDTSDGGGRKQGEDQECRDQWRSHIRTFTTGL